MKTVKDTLDILLKRLPLPTDCKLFGEASFPKEIANGVVVRRTLRMDVSKRIPLGTLPYVAAEPGTDDEIFYLELKDNLIDEIWEIISSNLEIAAENFKLTSERGESVRVFFSTENVVTIRSRFGHIEGRKTYWCIDFVAVVRTESDHSVKQKR